MVLEIAEFAILPGHEDEFTAAVDKGLAYIAATPGFLDARLTRGIETPGRFVLLIEWESVEAHTVGFRGSENFPRWRALISPHFAATPKVEHASVVAPH
jgi:heme-degrading monooxygenase HmoA